MNDNNNDSSTNLNVQSGQISDSNQFRAENVDFMEMWLKIWKNKWHITIVTVVFAISSIAIVLMMPNKYQSEVLLAPAEDTEGGIANMLSKLGGLANLAGINIGKKKLTKPTLAIEVMKSREFIKSFIERHDLLIPLMAAEEWDEDSNELIINPKKYDVATKTWVRDVSPPKKVIPSTQEAHEQFLKIFDINIDKDSTLIKMSVTFFSPNIAKQWIDWLILDINEHMRNLDKRDAEKSIQYLQEELDSTALAKMQNVFYQIIEEQTKIIMLANVRAEYVFKTIDPAVIPDEKDSPRRAVIVILATMLGGILGIISVLIREK